MNLTPHGPGFAFLDFFEMVQPGRQGRGRFWLDPKLSFFGDHFPGEPLMPGVLLIECGAQAAGALWASTLEAPAPKAFSLAQVLQFKILQPVRPAVTLESEVTLENSLGALAQFGLLLTVKGTEVARGRIVLAQPQKA